MTTAWFTGIPAASAEVNCGGEIHTVHWHDGALHTPAHADPEGERALAALGGDACTCVDLLSAWERHVADPQVLVLGPRGHELLGAGRFRNTPRYQRRRARLVQLGRGQDADPNPLEALLSLDGPIPRRLVATVAAALLERADEPGVAAELYGALYGRLLAAFRIWRASLPELELTVTGRTPSLTRTADGVMLARMPLQWLTEVWARDLHVVGDELTLSARPTTDGDCELLTVDHAMRTHIRTASGR